MKNKVLIWGTGKSAHTVLDYIKGAFCDEMEVVGYYSPSVHPSSQYNDLKVYELNEVIADSGELADVLIIPNPGKKISDILHMHQKIANKKCLFVPADKIRKPEKETYFVEIDINKPWLNGFEYHITDHCNLNCKGCGHCANLFSQPSYGDIAIYEQDLKRLSELFDGVGLIRLLGGEPLLNDDLDEFIKITKKHFKYAEIHIVTNGLLLTSMATNLIDCIKNNGVIIDISVYPPITDKLCHITEFLKENCIEFNVMPVEQFYKRFSLKKQYDKNDAFKSCGTATCHILFNGKIAPCIVPFSTEKLNDEFDTKIAVDGWIDIYDEDITGEKINASLKQPFELCAHCNPEKHFFAWEQKKYKDCELKDWICD